MCEVIDVIISVITVCYLGFTLSQRQKYIACLPIISIGLNRFSLFCLTCKYLLLTESEGRTVNCGQRFSPSIYGPSAKHTGHKSKGKNNSKFEKLNS